MGFADELEYTVIDLLIVPILFVLYFTFITPVFFFFIGSFGQLGTVQPHELFTLVNIKSALPLFLNTNSQVPSPPFFIVP